MAIQCARQPVIIMGMARSGTSLVAGSLHRLGLFLGHQKILADEEAKFFYRLNQILLRRIHGEFDNPAPMRYFLRESDAVEVAVRCLEADLESYRISGYLGLRQYLQYGSLRRYDKPWGWKDPQNTYTLPLWLRLFPRAKIVYVFRNGVDVAASLVQLQSGIIYRRQQRDQERSGRLSLRRNLERFGFKGAFRCLSLEGCFSLWEEYVAQAEETLAQLDNARRVIKYESFLADPKRHLEDLLRFCELEQTNRAIIDEIALKVNAARSNAFTSNPGSSAFYDRVKNSHWMNHYGYGRE